MLSQVLIKNEKGDYVNFRPSASKGEFINSNEVIRPLPEQKGRGHFSTFAICEGLALGICRCTFDEDYMAQFTLEKPLLSLGFCIKGHSLSWNSRQPDPVAMVPGRSYAHFFEDRVVEREIKGQQEVLTLAIHVLPDFLIKLLNPIHHQDAQYNDTWEKTFKSRLFYTDHIMTTQMTTTIYQILNNPHKGRVGNIYLESKALELIALRLEPVFQPNCSSITNTSMKPDDKERICRARDLLIKKLQCPPSLRELARQVGMSHTQLSREFRMVFGCTVFEYLRRERLSYARMLIEESPVDLTWVAFESGFCSSSHFAASFLKEYGVRPSEYRNRFRSVKRSLYFSPDKHPESL